MISDFLSAIYKHVINTLGRRIDEKIMDASTIAFVLTVPAIWSDAAKKVTEDAATRAGMGHQHSLQLLSEPESAAIYTLKTLDDINSIRIRDRVLVCDAGGGTVDLISYEIQSVDPLSIVECTAGSGDYCGSTFVDREFEKLFIRRMGLHYQNLSLYDIQQTIKNFESIKTAFRDDPDQEVFHVNVPTVGTLKDAGVYGGNFVVTRDEMRSLFDPVVDQIIGLLAAQAIDSSISSILLVGGFGESEYLFRRISAWASQTQLRILQPREASTAIVRGAVMKGLELAGSFRTQVVRRARRWYGVTFNEPFLEGKHRAEDRMYNVETGQILARNQVSWFIKKVISNPSLIYICKLMCCDPEPDDG